MSEVPFSLSGSKKISHVCQTAFGSNTLGYASVYLSRMGFGALKNYLAAFLTSK